MTCFPHWKRIYVLSHDCDKCYSHFRGSQLTAHYNYLGPLTVDQFLGPIRQTHAWTECHQVLKAPQQGDRCCIVAKSCPPLCNPMDLQHTMLPCPSLFHRFAQIHVHWVSDAIQPSHSVPPSSPLSFNLSQNQGLFWWVVSLHQVAKSLELQLQHRSFQWIFRADFLYKSIVLYVWKLLKK